MSPHNITREFERALCAYTGAPYAVAVTSCTMALTLAVAWHLQVERREIAGGVYVYPRLTDVPCGIRELEISIPKRTYIGVPYAIREAGGRPTFRDESWTGCYQLKPLPVWDSARWFTSGMYGEGGRTAMGCWWKERHAMACVSFHASKTLGDTQGGAILLYDKDAYFWLRRARFDGRTEGFAPKDDAFTLPRAWHCYLSPDVAARLLWQLSVLPRHNEPLPNDDYPDLSQLEAFK